jgi:hypothetical protein
LILHAIRSLGLGVILAFGLSTGAAQAVTPEDRSAVSAVVERFLAAFGAGDAEGMVSVMPPEYVTAHAQRVGIGPQTYRGLVVHFTEVALDNGAIEELMLDLAGMAFRETPVGDAFGLIPTRSVAIKNGERVEMISDTLALKDSGEWWLIQVNDDNQISVLREVYPAFANVTFRPAQRITIGRVD